MQNEAGVFVDKYVPRKCSTSNRIIGAKDHASVQMSLVDLDPKTGRMLSSRTVYNISGEVRRMGESDDSLNRLAIRDGILPANFHKQV